MMKTVSVTIPDDVYDRAERRAATRGATLPDEVAGLVRCYASEAKVPWAIGETEREPTETQDTRQHEMTLAKLFAVLNNSHNETSVGRLNRDELYDRTVLH